MLPAVCSYPAAVYVPSVLMLKLPPGPPAALHGPLVVYVRLGPRIMLNATPLSKSVLEKTTDPMPHRAMLAPAHPGADCIRLEKSMPVAPGDTGATTPSSGRLLKPTSTLSTGRALTGETVSEISAIRARMAQRVFFIFFLSFDRPASSIETGSGAHP